MIPGRPIEPRPARLAKLFPWTRLLRGPSLALDAQKLILAAVGLVLLRLGWRGLDWLFVRPEPTEWPGVFPRLLGGAPDPAGLPVVDAAEPFFVLISPFIAVFRTGGGPVAFAHAGFSAAWAVLVWGVIGGAIARMAAVQAATGERLGLVTALSFALRRWTAFVGAPLSPMLGIGFFAALIAPLGLLYRIPGPIGVAVAGGLAFIPLLAGLVMAMLLAGLAAGWPLMIATVAVEAEDAFDALSRSYSYVTQRPVRYALYAATSWVLGAIGLVVVLWLAALAVLMAQWGLGFGGPDGRIDALFLGDPYQSGAGASAHAFWMSVVRLLTRGWIYSYFFTAATLIFTLLRREVDGAPYHDLGDLDEPEEPFDGPARGELASPEERSIAPDA